MGTAPTVGSKAPSFTLASDTGETVSLADFAGRKLVLYFYPRADTPGCTREAIIDAVVEVMRAGTSAAICTLGLSHRSPDGPSFVSVPSPSVN